jgi:hypothetical protein
MPWLAEQQRKMAESSQLQKSSSPKAKVSAAAVAASESKHDDDDPDDGDYDDRDRDADEEDSHSEDEESPFGPFYPGLFMTNLMDRLVQLHSNKFEINLALTGVLAKLCLCPSPLLHAYLFEPAQSSRSVPRQATMMRMLAKVAALILGSRHHTFSLNL